MDRPERKTSRIRKEVDVARVAPAATEQLNLSACAAVSTSLIDIEVMVV